MHRYEWFFDKKMTGPQSDRNLSSPLETLTWRFDHEVWSGSREGALEGEKCDKCGGAEHHPVVLS